MRANPLLIWILVLGACGSNANRICTPVPTFSSPAGECVALAEAPKPPPPKPPPPKPEPEPEPEPEPPPPEPEPPPTVVVKADTIELDRTVQFESGKAKLVDDSKTLLDDVAKVLQEHAEIKVIQIEGHTDSVGSTRKNKKLSEARAKSVRAYLIEQGIAKQRMVAKGFGEAKPVADNGTDEGRFKNRRVDLRILKRDDAEADKPKQDDDADDEAKAAGEEDQKAKPKKKKKRSKKKKAKQAADDE